MAEIVDLKSASRLIWLCGHCGCTTFRLYDDHTAECAGCENISEGSQWVTPIQDKPKDPDKDSGGCVDVIGIGAVSLARRRVLKTISDKADDIAFVVAYFEDGAMSAWTGMETEEQRQWTLDRLRQLSDLLSAKPIG